MSLKTLLMPVISQRWLSRDRLLAQRRKAETRRQRAGAHHELHFFFQVDDPYSLLAANALTDLQTRYGVEIQVHLVSPPADNAAPEREKLQAYSRKDAQLLARRWGLSFTDPGRQPGTDALRQAHGLLCAAANADDSNRLQDLLVPVATALWASVTETNTVWPHGPVASAEHVVATLAQGDAMRKSMGHYLGATFFYAGEWYWGIDRLYHLELRLKDLGLQNAPAAPLFPASTDLNHTVTVNAPPPIEFFFSLRSPYSAIVAPRVFALGERTGAAVHLRYVLPMAMRGLPVPREKRMYISLDTAREAHARGIPFGRLNDPIGRPTERGLALMPYAERAGLGQNYVLSFMRGVWAQGLDAGSDRGLRRIVERAGLNWEHARDALRQNHWRAEAERNREAMFSHGLWGVPSFVVHDTAVWGQDRLWAVEEALLAYSAGATP
jgi:2-hydroxychromene-2-carboxylate isomerase